MKKNIFQIVLILFAVVSVSGQSLAVKAGYTSGIFKIKNDFFDASDSEGGFHVGVVASFEATENIDVQPEILFTSVNSSSYLQIPVLAAYQVSDSGISVQAGPQFNLSLEETGEDFSAFSVGLALGAGYDITEEFFAEIHYALQLTNSFTGEVQEEIGAATVKTNFLNLGVGYRFM